MKYLSSVAGAVTSAFVTLCCIGVPAVLSVVAAVGAGFLIRDAVLLPLLVVCLGIAAYGMFTARKRHGRNAPIVVFFVSVVAILVSIWISNAGAIAGAVLLITATVMNITMPHRATAKQRLK